MDNVVEKIRAFNRFYMPSMNLLGNRYLGSEYSVTEARIFFEIYENKEISSIVSGLSDQERRQLSKAIDTIQNILSGDQL